MLTDEDLGKGSSAVTDHTDDYTLAWDKCPSSLVGQPTSDAKAQP